MFSSAVGAALLTQFKGHVQLKVVRCFGNMLWLKTAWQGPDIILFNLVNYFAEQGRCIERCDFHQDTEWSERTCKERCITLSYVLICI